MRTTASSQSFYHQHHDMQSEDRPGWEVAESNRPDLFGSCCKTVLGVWSFFSGSFIIILFPAEIVFSRIPHIANVFSFSKERGTGKAESHMKTEQYFSVMIWICRRREKEM